jgi:hypothetical protein
MFQSSDWNIFLKKYEDLLPSLAKKSSRKDLEITLYFCFTCLYFSPTDEIPPSGEKKNGQMVAYLTAS